MSSHPAPAAYERIEQIDPAKLVSAPPRLTVLSRSWFRLLFAPTGPHTPAWLGYADIVIDEERGAVSWRADPRTPAWRLDELSEYGRLLTDAHNDVCATRMREALAAPGACAPEVPVEIESEVTGFRLILLTPSLVEPQSQQSVPQAECGPEPEHEHDGDAASVGTGAAETEPGTETGTDAGPDSPDDPDPTDPTEMLLWLAPARATLYPPDAYELDVPASTPPWLLEKYRTIIDDIYCKIGFTLQEADSVVRTFAPGSQLLVRLTTSFPIPEGYRRLVCSRFRNEGPQRDASLLPRLLRLGTGLYRLDFPASHEAHTLTFDLVNKTGTMSPDNPSTYTLEYLETYLLAMRTVFGDDDGEGEFAALGDIASELERTTLDDDVKAGVTTRVDGDDGDKPDRVSIEEETPQQRMDKVEEKVRIIQEKLERVLPETETGRPALVETPDVLSPVTAPIDIPPETAADNGAPEDGTMPPPASDQKDQREMEEEPPVVDRMRVVADDPKPPAYPVDIDEVYAEFRVRVLDIYNRSPPRQDQLALLQERHQAFLRSGPGIDRPLSAAEGEALLDNIEACTDGMVPPLLRRWYALMQLNLPIWGQDLPRLSARIASLPPHLQRDELVGAEFEFDGEDETCPICTDVVRPRDALAITPCYHLMHRDCLENWFDSGPETESCPVCRRDFVLYESLLAITRYPYFEVAWKAWMGQLEDDGGEQTEERNVGEHNQDQDHGLDGFLESEDDDGESMVSRA